MGIEESKVVKEVLQDLAESTKIGYVNTLNRFVNEFVRDKTIDGLVKEAETDVKKTQQRIDAFYKWLQNEKRLKESSAYVIAYGYLRGFFVNLDVAFQRKWKKSIPKVKRARKALKKDKVYTFFDVDEKTRTIRFNRERMQRFLSNLKLRDVAITLALLSSSQDSGDLFKLNIGDIREQENNRVFWEGNRQKTDVLFRTFFSKEAARFIRRYIQQERRGAGDEDPLFVYTTRHRGQEKPIEERMIPSSLASIYRDAARKMGIKWENGEQNPLRPKRMRHLFRTACDTAGITELYTNAYMGHKNHQGQDYSEISRAVLELEYLHACNPLAKDLIQFIESCDTEYLFPRREPFTGKVIEGHTSTTFIYLKVREISDDLWPHWLRAQRASFNAFVRDMNILNLQKWFMWKSADMPGYYVNQTLKGMAKQMGIKNVPI